MNWRFLRGVFGQQTLSRRLGAPPRAGSSAEVDPDASRSRPGRPRSRPGRAEPPPSRRRAEPSREVAEVAEVAEMAEVAEVAEVDVVVVVEVGDLLLEPLALLAVELAVVRRKGHVA